MSTIDLTVGTKAGKGSAATYAKPIKLVYRLVDLVKATTAKGSALASGDIIKAIRLPLGTHVLRAGMKVITGITPTTTASAGLGTNSDTTKFCAQTNDITVATFIASANVSGVNTLAINTSGTDSINIIIGTYTATTPTDGLIAVYAYIADMNEFPGANIDATTNQAGVPQA